MVQQSIEETLKDKIYNDLEVQEWIDKICSSVTKKLIGDNNKPYKYLGL
jgi:hypothetical protein